MNKTISVYFSGTGFSINDDRFLTASLLTRTQDSETHIKMGFNGCGVDYGFNGAIFGSGLDKQCEQVIDCVMQELNAGHQITLNAHGHSRGGIAALLLAKQLGTIDKERLAINLALLDPVPGNLITTSNIDPFQISLANKTMDLSDCTPLRKVLALYSHIPLPSIECHAPLLVSYPQETEVEEEVVNGGHMQMGVVRERAAKLVTLRIEEFLVKNGTQLQTNKDYNDTEAMKQTYLRLYQQELAYVARSLSRETHSARSIVITATPGAKYLNNYHKALHDDNSQESVCLSMQPKKGLFSSLRRLFTNYPLVGESLKWTLIALSVATLLYFSGGFAAIPLLAPVVAKLGMLSLLVFSPAIGGALVALWHSTVKPILSWCASKFFYPHYATRKIEASMAETPDSTRGIIGTLNVGRSSAANSLNVDSVPYQEKSPLHSARTVTKENVQYGNEQADYLSFTL